MDSRDLDRLRKIAALPEEDSAAPAFAAASVARMRAAAQHVLRHAEQFDLDTPEVHGASGRSGVAFSASAYIASAVTDLLHLAEQVSEPAGVRTPAHHVLALVSSNVSCDDTDLSLTGISL